MILSLQDSVNTIKGIGIKTAEALERLDIRTLDDLLSFFPRSYEDRRTCLSTAELTVGETALVKGTIQLMVPGGFGKRRHLTLLVTDESGGIEVVFFGAAYLEKTLSKDVPYFFYGKVTERNGKLQMMHPDFRKAEGAPVGIVPVYPLTEGVRQAQMRKWMEQIRGMIPLAADPLPVEILRKNRLCGLSYALENIHFPETAQKLREAKYRLIYEELFLLRLGIIYLQRRNRATDGGIPFSPRADWREYTDTLPFPLTDAQFRVLEEIKADMESQRPMNRLIQGDVGSGKTAVAAAAAYKAIKSGYQAVLMAPTELLARQHFEGLSEQFHPLGIRVGFLRGSMKAAERRETLAALAKGEIQLLIGTHALLQPDVAFQKLGLVITDEQHRFGVSQRVILSRKGRSPDILVMTATPIPRTLAFALYGDLDLSFIDQLPPGRKPIHTKAVSERGRKKAYDFLRQETEKGRQAYVVTPLISDSEEMEHVRSAEGVFEEVQSQMADLSSALLHGAMKQSEKDRIMGDFNDGKIRILVSTVVIEVGINVPNATVMLIENAERFGLAQLHQLRGRVGRGGDQSYCILVTEGKSEYAKQRAEIMTASTDGAYIAEKDLELRGPGEFFGVRQHGLPDLRIADLSRHGKILAMAGDAAQMLLDEDPDLSEPGHQPLKQKMEDRFRRGADILT